MFLSAKTPLVAIDIGSNSVKVAQLGGSRNRYELLSLGVMPLEYEAIVDGVIRNEEVVVDAISRIVKAEKIQTRYAVASVAGEAVIIKKITVPLMTEKELEENINQEAEQYIPFDIDDVSLDFQILGQTGLGNLGEEEDEPKMEILLVAVQRDIIDNRTDILNEAGLKPVIVDLDVFAASNALGIYRDVTAMGGVALIDLGASFTHINIMSAGQIAFTRDIPMGGLQCTQKLMSEFNMEYQEAENLKLGQIPSGVDKKTVVEVIVNSFDGIVEEVEKAFEFFSTTSNAQVDQVFLSGGGSMIQGADGLLSRKLNVPVEILNPLEAIKVSRKFDKDLIEHMGPLSSVAVGLATRKFDYAK